MENDDEQLTESFATKEDTERSKSVEVDSKLYWCSLVMGFAVLEPWNEILSCMNYFQDVYNPVGYQPEFTLAMIIFLPLVACQFFLIAYGKYFSMRLKVVTCMAILTFLVYVFLLVCRSVENKNVSFFIIVGITLVIGIFNGIVQSSVGGLMGAMGGNGK